MTYKEIADRLRYKSPINFTNKASYLELASYRIIKMLNEHSGFDDWWDDLVIQDQEEIFENIKAIISDNLDRI